MHTLPTDTFISAAFAELLEDVTSLLAAADDKDERAFWRRQQTALNKAQYHYLNGVRPQLTEGAYLMPSATSSGLNVYRLSRVGGILVCDCKAGQNGILCYHHMLINVLERATELETLAARREDVAGDPPDIPDQYPEPTEGDPEDPGEWRHPIAHAAAAAEWIAAHQQLTARLDATAQLLDAMRNAQQRPAETTDQAARRLGVRLVTARKRSAYFTSAFYLAA